MERNLIETKDERVVGEILRPYINEIQGELEDAIFLVYEDNLIIFEELSPKVYRGHYFFNSARGKEAKELCKRALELIFEKAEVIQGWTPLEKKGAALLSRWLGFTSYGIVNDTFELFILTKQEWSKLNG